MASVAQHQQQHPDWNTTTTNTHSSQSPSANCTFQEIAWGTGQTRSSSNDDGSCSGGAIAIAPTATTGAISPPYSNNNNHHHDHSATNPQDYSYYNSDERNTLALQALRAAVTAAQHFDVSFDRIQNAQHEISVPLFHSQEIILASGAFGAAAASSAAYGNNNNNNNTDCSYRSRSSTGTSTSTGTTATATTHRNNKTRRYGSGFTVEYEVDVVRLQPDLLQHCQLPLQVVKARQRFAQRTLPKQQQRQQAKQGGGGRRNGEEQEQQQQQEQPHVNVYCCKVLQAGILASDFAVTAAVDMIVECKILMNLAHTHPHLCQIYGINQAGVDALLETPGSTDSFFILTDRIEDTLQDRLEFWRRSANTNTAARQSKTNTPKLSAKVRSSLTHSSLLSTSLASLNSSTNNNNNNNNNGNGNNNKKTEHSADTGMNLQSRLEIMLDICSALQYLHGKQLVFYIRPDKVGFDVKYGRVKLCQFSQTRQVGMKSLPSSITKSDDLKTLAYTAPEVLCKGTPATVSSDVYGFGIILWELITLQIPYDGYNRSMLYEDVLTCHMRPVIPMHHNISTELRQLLEECWHPHVRPTMKNVYERLENALLYTDFSAAPANSSGGDDPDGAEQGLSYRHSGHGENDTTNNDDDDDEGEDQEHSHRHHPIRGSNATNETDADRTTSTATFYYSQTEGYHPDASKAAAAAACGESVNSGESSSASSGVKVFFTNKVPHVTNSATYASLLGTFSVEPESPAGNHHPVVTRSGACSMQAFHPNDPDSPNYGNQSDDNGGGSSEEFQANNAQQQRPTAQGQRRKLVGAKFKRRKGQSGDAVVATSTPGTTTLRRRGSNDGGVVDGGLVSSDDEGTDGQNNTHRIHRHRVERRRANVEVGTFADAEQQQQQQPSQQQQPPMHTPRAVRRRSSNGRGGRLRSESTEDNRTGEETAVAGYRQRRSSTNGNNRMSSNMNCPSDDCPTTPTSACGNFVVSSRRTRSFIDDRTKSSTDDENKKEIRRRNSTDGSSGHHRKTKSDDPLAFATVDQLRRIVAAGFATDSEDDGEMRVQPKDYQNQASPRRVSTVRRQGAQRRARSPGGAAANQTPIRGTVRAGESSVRSQRGPHPKAAEKTALRAEFKRTSSLSKLLSRTGIDDDKNHDKVDKQKTSQPSSEGSGGTNLKAKLASDHAQAGSTVGRHDDDVASAKTGATAHESSSSCGSLGSSALAAAKQQQQAVEQQQGEQGRKAAAEDDESPLGGKPNRASSKDQGHANDEVDEKGSSDPSKKTASKQKGLQRKESWAPPEDVSTRRSSSRSQNYNGGSKSRSRSTSVSRRTNRVVDSPIRTVSKTTSLSVRTNRTATTEELSSPSTVNDAERSKPKIMSGIHQPAPEYDIIDDGSPGKPKLVRKDDSNFVKPKITKTTSSSQRQGPRIITPDICPVSPFTAVMFDSPVGSSPPKSASNNSKKKKSSLAQQNMCSKINANPTLIFDPAEMDFDEPSFETQEAPPPFELVSPSPQRQTMRRYNSVRQLNVAGGGKASAAADERRSMRVDRTLPFTPATFASGRPKTAGQGELSKRLEMSSPVKMRPTKAT